jgi:hypothetical protein
MYNPVLFIPVFNFALANFPFFECWAKKETFMP